MRNPRRVLLPNPGLSRRGVEPPIMALVQVSNRWPKAQTCRRVPLSPHRGSSLITVQVPEGVFYSNF